MSSKSSRIAAAVPGTPDTAVSPVSTSRPSRDGEVCRRDRVGVDHVDPHGGLAVGACQQPTFEGERADAGEQVAAVLAVGDEAVADAELQEQVLEIGAIVARRRRRSRPST